MLNSKKVASLGLAMAMAATMAVPAFAAETTKTNTSTKVSATYSEIPISVTVPETGTAQINPYGLPVEYKNLSSSTSKTAKVSGQQIVTQPLYISNDGDVALSVGATVTTTAKGVEIITKKDDIAKSTEKQAYVELQMAKSALKSLADDAAKDKITAEYATDATWSSASKLTLSTDDAVSNPSDTPLATLVASKVTTTTNDDNTTTTTVTYSEGSIWLFRLSGSVVTAPETAWSTNDNFTATIAFTFTPTTISET